MAKTLPVLRGPLIASGPWSALIGRPNMRVYPFELGSVIASILGTTLTVQTAADFANTDYVIVCSALGYGNTTMFVPDMNKIRQISSGGGTTALVLNATVTVAAGDYLLNISNDTATSPLVTPNFSDAIPLFTGPAVAQTSAFDYVLTGDGGAFTAWLPAAKSNLAVDLLITDASGIPVAVIPYVGVGPSL